MEFLMAPFPRIRIKISDSGFRRGEAPEQDGE